MTDWKAMGRNGGMATRGERKGNAKLTEDKVRAIRQSALGLTALSREYGVSIGAIRHVLSGANWSHVQ